MFVPPACVCVAVVRREVQEVVDLEGAGGQGEQRGGRNFLEEQRIISPPIHFLPLSTLPTSVKSLDVGPPNQPQSTLFYQHIF